MEQLLKDSNIEIHILYYGDFDPSGDQAIDDLISRLGKIPLSDSMNKKEKNPDLQWVSVLDCINFEHVAVTKEQVERFKLPSEIDEKTRQKLEGYWKPDGTWKKPDPNRTLVFHLGIHLLMTNIFLGRNSNVLLFDDYDIGTIKEMF